MDPVYTSSSLAHNVRRRPQEDLIVEAEANFDAKRPKHVLANESSYLLAPLCWSTRQAFLTGMMNGPYGLENGYTLVKDISSKYRGQRVARVFCKTCTGFYAVARSYAAIDYAFELVPDETNLIHQTVFPDGSVAVCTGSIEVPVGVETVASNPVFQSLLQMDKDHHHSGRVGTKILQKALGSLPVPLAASVDVIKKAAVRAGGYTMEDHEEGFSLLEPWLQRLKELNPGLVALVERIESDDTLNYAIEVFPYAEAAAPFMLPMFCIDGAHMKMIVTPGSEKQRIGKRVALALSGRTAANNQLPLAIGIFKTESYEGGYKELLRALPPNLLSYINRPLTIVSTDRGPAALELFEDGNELDKASSLLGSVNNIWKPT
jgi:hypothetical protein